MNSYILTAASEETGNTAQLIAWVAIIVFLLVIEASTSSLTTIWFACGALVSAVMAALDVSLEVQIITFICASTIILVLTRPLAKRFLLKNVNTNKDTLIGVTSYVSERIDNLAQSGYVKINDVYWAARSADNTVIEQGELVRVTAIQGNKLIVESVKNDK